MVIRVPSGALNSTGIEPELYIGFSESKSVRVCPTCNFKMTLGDSDAQSTWEGAGLGHL